MFGKEVGTALAALTSKASAMGAAGLAAHEGHKKSGTPEGLLTNKSWLTRPRKQTEGPRTSIKKHNKYPFEKRR